MREFEDIFLSFSRAASVSNVKTFAVISNPKDEVKIESKIEFAPRDIEEAVRKAYAHVCLNLTSATDL